MEQYNSIIKKIMETPLSEITGKDFSTPLSSNRHKLRSDKADFRSQYLDRDVQYTELLSKYIDLYERKAKRNEKYKLSFFIITMSMFVLLIAVPFVLFFIIACKESASVSDAVMVFGGIAGIVSAVIVLPKIIAEHLFPANEDENMIGMVQHMQLNDSKIREMFDAVKTDEKEQE